MSNPMPEGFRERFIKNGWRGVERYYGARTAVNQRWIAECGGLKALQAERRAYLDAKNRTTGISE